VADVIALNNIGILFLIMMLWDKKFKDGATELGKKTVGAY